MLIKTAEELVEYNFWSSNLIEIQIICWIFTFKDLISVLKLLTTTNKSLSPKILKVWSVSLKQNLMIPEGLQCKSRTECCEILVCVDTWFVFHSDWRSRWRIHMVTTFKNVVMCYWRWKQILINWKFELLSHSFDLLEWYKK